MNDYIDRQAALEILATMQGLCTSKTALIQNSKIWQQIKELPPAEVEPVKRGKWIKNENRNSWHCSYCNVDNYYAYAWNSETRMDEFQDRYCPNCGAKMEEGDEE